MVHAPPQIRSHAREMRKGPTRPEDRLWSWLRNRRFGDYKFRRQHPTFRRDPDNISGIVQWAIDQRK